MKATPSLRRKAPVPKKSPALLDGPEACAFVVLEGVAATLATLSAEDVAGKDVDGRTRGDMFLFLAQSVRCADQILRRGRR